MRVSTVVTIEDPKQQFRQVVEPEFADAMVKQANITLSHSNGKTRVEVKAEDASSMRAGVTAIMNALRVFSQMSEVSSDGHHA